LIEINVGRCLADDTMPALAVWTTPSVEPEQSAVPIALAFRFSHEGTNPWHRF